MFTFWLQFHVNEMSTHWAESGNSPSHISEKCSSVILLGRGVSWSVETSRVALLGSWCAPVELLIGVIVVNGGCEFKASGAAEGKHRLERSGREPLMLRENTADGKKWSLYGHNEKCWTDDLKIIRFDFSTYNRKILQHAVNSTNITKLVIHCDDLLQIL